MNDKPREVSYRIPGNEKGGTLLVLGNPKASQLIFLHAGYPDDHQPFLPLATKLAFEHDSLVGIACLPGYNDPDPLAGGYKPGGYTFEEVLTATREAVTTLRAQQQQLSSDVATHKKIHYIFHDWGVVIGSIFVNRILEEGPSVSRELLPGKVVFLDVLPPPHGEDTRAILGPNPPRLSFLARVREMTYRGVLAASFALQRYIHSYIAIPFLLSNMTILKCIGLSPVTNVDLESFRERKQSLSLSRMIWMAYPYYNIFNGDILSVVKKYRLPKKSSHTPVLYMYGADKNFMFHDPAGVKLLENHGASSGEYNNGSQVVRVEHAGHWLFLQQPKLCYDKISSFLFGDT